MTFNSEPTKKLNFIGHYEVLERIGQGGMGVVYLARDTRLNRQVAIKCLRSELCEPQYRERFKNEALLLAKLNHPHIVQIYDYIETPDHLAFVMELVDGKNLHIYLREHIVPSSQRMHWLTQIAQGLAVAHDAGIIHRDLKAENVLINNRGEAKISDLGIAKSQEFNATLTNHVAGSYAAMSPEQAMGETLDTRSDLFSFGILAYQLLCGAHPFGETDNKLQLMQRIISHPPTPPRKHNPHLSIEMSELLLQLLSKNPENRPANTHWLAAQCEKLSHLTLAISPEPDYTQELSNSYNSQTRSPLKENTNRSETHRTDKHITKEYKAFTIKNINATPSVAQKIVVFVKHNPVSTALGCLTLFILLAASILRLQPKQPHYIAVLPPILTTHEMPEPQQELVISAVYDAIQQSVLQLDGYYLIPQNEIADINLTNNAEGMDTVRRATAADELMTTDIQCKMEACTITLSRLMPEGKTHESRLHVKDTKTVDVLTDNYLSIAEAVKNHIAEIYALKKMDSSTQLNNIEYSTFLSINKNYLTEGASVALLEKLENLSTMNNKSSAMQVLFRDISLDLYYEKSEKIYLDKLAAYLAIPTNHLATPTNSRNEKIAYLLNLYHMKIAENKFSEALATIADLKKMNVNGVYLYELEAYLDLVQNSYESAILRYKQISAIKPSATTYQNIARAYWRLGNYINAKEFLNKALALSPNDMKSNQLNGIIALSEGDTTKAIEYFTSALTHKNDITNMSNLGLSYLLIKNYNEAMLIFKEVHQLAPENAVYLLNYADALNLSGNKEHSENLYKEITALEVSANKNDLIRIKAQAYAHLKNFKSAIETIQTIEKNDTQNSATLYASAVVYTLANEKTSALVYIEKSLQSNIHKMWFDFSWFDNLCNEPAFLEIMKIDEGNENNNRCKISTQEPTTKR